MKNTRNQNTKNERAAEWRGMCELTARMGCYISRWAKNTEKKMKTFYVKIVWDTKFQKNEPNKFASEIVEVKALNATLAKAGALTKFNLNKKNALAKNAKAEKVSENKWDLTSMN